ncbi:F-box only protein 28-like [Ctenocephalides felis]|uniref:F-box only protein 28-like n=1 Tax=Ctenocephalides felis TaxID=7515 RepID=UPI000E6E4349|nr:F-box only protein 28-like [Ctenocephalides felis]
MNILQSPDIVLEHILSYLSFDEISKMRLVCKSFNKAAQRLLNRGFITMEKKHAAFLKNVKARLPRRESERRYHPLSRHCDILTSIETRISMMSMTYSKYIEQNICCFIPGKVIDEVLRVLKVLELTNNPPRAHEILQELRDISSMAIEHFDEKICPLLKATQTNNAPRENTFVLNRSLPSTSQEGYETQDSNPFKNAFNKNLVDKVLTDALTKKFIGLSNQFKKIKELYATQNKRLIKQSRTIKRQSNEIGELRRRIDDWETKHKEITANVNQMNSYEHSQPISRTISTSQVFERVAPVICHMLDNAVNKLPELPKKCNIKPRMAQITLKRYSNEVKEDDQKKMKFSY